MTWRDRNGPRPPSRRRVENQLQQHVRKLTGLPPLCLDPHNRSPLVPLLRAHRDWRLASHPQRQQDQGAPAGRVPEIKDRPPASRGNRYLGLRIVITLTFAVDLGMIFAAVGVGATSASNGAAVSVLLAVLILVLYIGSGLGADRRHQVATARIDAYFRVLAADTALTLAAAFHDPASTDALTASLNEEEPR